MADLQQALQTQLANIETRTGKSLAELAAILAASGLSKHTELRDFLKREHALGHGDANTLVHHVLRHSQAAPAPGGADRDPLDSIYVGPKAALRPIHEALMRAVDRMGPCEQAPKKGYVSLRRRRQFAMIGPATQTRVELGLNVKALPPSERLVEVAPGGMCNYKTRIGSIDEVDAELVGWLRRAFEAAA